MNTLTVREYLKQLVNVKNVDVCAADGLPAKLTASTAIVANTEPHTESGEHWIAIYVRDNADDVIEYFDSYGRPPSDHYVLQLLRRNSQHYKYVWNKYRLQGFETTVCGLYCLTYLKCRADLSMSMGDYVQMFSYTNTEANDACVKRLFHNLFTISTP